METFQILSNQFSHFQHPFHRWLAIFCIISSYIFDLSSSPHTWGIPGSITWSQQWRTVHPHIRRAYGWLLGFAQFCGRFIPTYVGHTEKTFPWGLPSTVHPHIRGAYAYRLHMDHLKLRFIPTYVGHTLGTPLISKSTAVHPHIHGATSSTCQMVARTSVHPHLRGAYLRGTQGNPRNNGSSPPTWGIPTSRKSNLTQRLVHPHLRGAYSCLQWAGPTVGRFIPTYVGHT